MKRWTRFMNTISKNNSFHTFIQPSVEDRNSSGRWQVRCWFSHPIVHNTAVTYKLQTSFQLTAIQKRLQWGSFPFDFFIPFFQRQWLKANPGNQLTIAQGCALKETPIRIDVRQSWQTLINGPALTVCAEFQWSQSQAWPANYWYLLNMW